MNPGQIAEARRYLDNARELLSAKGRKEDGYYRDAKYVKLAGHAAYSGVLYALDQLLEKKTKSRKDVDWYKAGVAKLDRKLLDKVNDAYEFLHLMMGYDGNGNVKMVNIGLETANSIIDWVETRKGQA